MCDPLREPSSSTGQPNHVRNGGKMRVLHQIARDFRYRENLDVYITLLATIAVGVVLLTVSLTLPFVLALVVLVFVLMTFVLLRSRHQTSVLIRNQERSGFIFSERSPITSERLRAARSVSHNGISLVGTSSRLLGVLSDLAGEGVPIRLLVVDYDDVASEIAARRFAKHQDPARLKREVKHALDNFSTILDRDQQSFEIRALKAVPSYSLWILDEGMPSEEIWLGLYPFQDEPEPWIHIKPHADRYLFEFMVRQFRGMWAVSRSWTPAIARAEELRKNDVRKPVAATQARSSIRN
jgi:hypothetical protein